MNSAHELFKEARLADTLAVAPPGCSARTIIEEVMAAQSDLVETLATFHPGLVKMAPAGEPPED